MYSKKWEELIITAMADNNEYKEIVVPQEVAKHLFFNMEYNITSYRNYLDSLSNAKLWVSKNQDKVDEAMKNELKTREANLEAVVLRRKDFLEVITKTFPEWHKDWFDNYDTYFNMIVNSRQAKQKEENKNRIARWAEFLSWLTQLEKEWKSIWLK